MKIKIELNNYEEALSKFNKEKISEDLDNYIFKNCKYKIFKSEHITLNIYGIKAKDEQEALTTLIHNHYAYNTNLTKRFDIASNLIKIILLVMGIIAIIISKSLNSIFSEIFLIIGWLMVWEIFYDILFNEIKRKMNYKISKTLSQSEINFIN